MRGCGADRVASRVRQGVTVTSTDPGVVAAVARAAAHDAGGVDPALLGHFLPIVVEAASSGRRLRRAELTACGERGAAAALAGVPLRALIDLYLSACWRLWEELDVVAGPDATRVRAAGLAVAVVAVLLVLAGLFLLAGALLVAIPVRAVSRRRA